jgi:hypothetical protein
LVDLVFLVSRKLRPQEFLAARDMLSRSNNSAGFAEAYSAFAFRESCSFVIWLFRPDRQD